MLVPLPIQDKRLVQILDAAFVDAEWRSGDWLICKTGCTSCCIGVFAIDQLDALRLQAGLAKLDETDPSRSARVRQRSLESWDRLAPEFPGDVTTGVLGTDEEAAENFEEFADYEPCPALDPEHGTCDVYEFRPVTCRVFGPPVRSEGGLGVCELCYHGASNDEIASCALRLDEANTLQSELVSNLEAGGKGGNTIVAFVLNQQLPSG